MTPTPESILLVCTRRLGDVLLATPALHACRKTWPQARIDLLVFAHTAAVLQGVEAVSNIITVAERSSWRQRWSELRRLRRRYDAALSLTPSDRARIYAWAAARRRYGVVGAAEPPGKCWMLDGVVVADEATPTLCANLQVAALAGAEGPPLVLAPTAGGALPVGVTKPYAVLHPQPRFNYKMWREDGWVGLAAALQQRGMQVWLSGGDDASECAAAGRIAAASGAGVLAGKLSLAQSADLLRQAALYVGADTVMTHMAAATGAPVIALFGPTNPVLWGPWPKLRETASPPWRMRGGGRNGNVYLLQGEGECTPCGLEGCDKHIASFSRCLQELSLQRVLQAVDEMSG